jgi:hypothetical protein
LHPSVCLPTLARLCLPPSRQTFPTSSTPLPSISIPRTPPPRPSLPTSRRSPSSTVTSVISAGREQPALRAPWGSRKHEARRARALARLEHRVGFFAGCGARRRLGARGGGSRDPAWRLALLVRGRAVARGASRSAINRPSLGWAARPGAADRDELRPVSR